MSYILVNISFCLNVYIKVNIFIQNNLIYDLINNLLSKTQFRQ